MFTPTYETLLIRGIQAIEGWQKTWPAFAQDDTLQIDQTRIYEVFWAFTEKLKDNYPHFHPAYAGQMLKPPHPVAMVGYLLTMLINPNNHALDSSPATSQMEKECIEALGGMFGLQTPLGHLTGGGTVANLEALWVARQLHPDKAIVFSEQAHYTHRRMTELLGVKTHTLPATPQGTMDLEALKSLLACEPVGTVVVTLGTTALGALDSLPDIVALKHQYGFRIHVDAAYGGYYALLAASDPAFSAFQSVKDCDSVVIDPHKQGLQPYGCGCVLFADPAVGQLYVHDSPYTYFSSNDLHLGEISLECSRSGSAAAALWLTMQYFPLVADAGMGPILQKTRRAALQFAEGLKQSPGYQLYLPPAMDIVTYFPAGNTTQEISRRTEVVFRSAMTDIEKPLYLAKLTVTGQQFNSLYPDIAVDSEQVVILRSCLIKPEHEAYVPELMAGLEHHAQTPVS